MSSILKALRRVEQASPAGETPLHPPVSAEATSLRSPGMRLGWLKNKNRAGLLALALLLAVAGAAYFWWKPEGTLSPDADSTREVRGHLPPRPPAPAAQAGPSAPRTAQPQAAPFTPRPRETAPTPGPLQAHSTSAVQAPPPTSRVRPRDASPPAPVATRPAPARSPASPPERPDKSRQDAPRAADDALSRLDESKLKVMAIAWSGDPSRRLAVVNGHIVKEGETVDGFSVTQIRKDDIIVNDGGRSWRVELNLKAPP